MRGADGRAADLLERQLELFGAGALALRQIGLHAQARQRRLQLMRGIGQEALLRGHGFVQAAQQIVHRIHQWRHLHGHGLVIERRQIIGLARADAFFQLVQRLDAARQRQPHQQHGQRQHDHLRQHHALDDFRGQHAALGARLGHLHQRGGRIGQRHTHPDVGNADVHAAHFCIAQPHLSGERLFIVIGLGQIALAREKAPIRRQHLVVDDVGFIGAQNLAGRLRQVELHLALLHRHQLRQRLRVVFQRAVERLVGQALRHQPGQRQTHRPQQKQRREHPVQDLAKQGTLLSLKDLQGRAFKGLMVGDGPPVSPASHSRC
ncbi:hypothetical protein SDC9_85498 [bioreactor metagenome]|uniref:Uncharacterized protein n=1 Tax=bioreactor metagenome TaxID=1076179 RepID=A0A644ZEZ2_9ZZZZ